MEELFFNYIVPMGGAQAQRLYEGFQEFGVIPDINLSFDRENGIKFDFDFGVQDISASYNDNGELRFPMKKSPWNMFKGLLFGKYATKEGKAYIDESRKPMSEKRTEAFNEVVRSGADANKVYDIMNDVIAIKGAEQAERQRRALMDADLTAQQKSTLDAAIVGERENPVDYSDEDKFIVTSAFDKESQRKRALDIVSSGMSAKNAVKHMQNINKLEGDKDETGNTISGSQKLKQIRYIHNLNVSDEQKGALYRNCMISDNKNYVLARTFGLDDATLGRAYPYLALTEGNKNASGKTISGSKNKKLSAVISSIPGLTNNQKIGLRAMFMTGKSQEYYENALVEAVYRLNRLSAQQKRDFRAWYYYNDQRVDEEALIKALLEK